MSLEIDVLRALLRLARRRTAPSMEQLLVRVDAEPRDVHHVLGVLSQKNLVRRTPTGIGLTFAGFAVAVACAKRPQKPAVRPSVLMRAKKTRRAA